MFGDRALELARFATSLLGWRPDEFWKATPAELATALGFDEQGSGQIDRDELGKLRALFPDQRET